MQHLDKNTLFSIFEADDEEVYKEHELTDLLDNPYVLMGMVVKGLRNFEIIDIMYTRSYKDEYLSIRHNVKHRYYTKLVSYLDRIQDESFDAIYSVGDSYDADDVMDSMRELLTHFEYKEDYSKCSTIIKYHELIAGVIINRELSVNLIKDSH